MSTKKQPKDARKKDSARGKDAHRGDGRQQGQGDRGIRESAGRNCQTGRTLMRSTSWESRLDSSLRID